MAKRAAKETFRDKFPETVFVVNSADEWGEGYPNLNDGGSLEAFTEVEDDSVNNGDLVATYELVSVQKASVGAVVLEEVD